MRAITSLIAALAFVVSGAAADPAPKPTKKSFQTGWFPPEAAGAEAVAWVAEGMSFEGNFHVWYLLGEPVINCTARWTNGANAQVTIKSGDGQALIERAQDGEVEVYNLVLASTAPDPRYSGGDESQIAVFCDAGVVAQNGRDGFNVAGSPSWDRFICAVDRGYKDFRLRFTDDDLCKAVGGNWLDAAAAKSVAIKGLDSRKVGLWKGEVKALKAEVSGMPVMKRVEKRLWREKSAAFKRERARAYFSDFPARSGEDEWDVHMRKMDAMNSLPDLPSENPTADQLKAYETAWQAMIVENAPGAAFEKEWRGKEKALVGEQLDRVKPRAKAAADEEARFSRYFAELQKLKENEPKQVDPMAEYRTDTPLTPYAYGERRNLVCGLKRPDGTVVLEYTNSDLSLEKCPGQIVKGFDIYADIRRQESESTTFYDRNGTVLHTSPYRTVFYRENDKRLEYGLIATSGGSSERPLVYSLLSRKTLIDNRTQIFSKATGWHEIYTSSNVYLRNGRPAMVFYLTSYNSNKDTGCPYDYNQHLFPTAYRYLYLDTEHLEEGEICAPPDEDPLNMKVE